MNFERMGDIKVAEGHNRLMPYLRVEGAGKLIEFLKIVFEAEETFKLLREENKVQHAEIKIGENVVMISESNEEFKPEPANIYIYVENADTTFEKALRNGGTAFKKPAKQSYAAKGGGFKDPSGNTWWISSL